MVSDQSSLYGKPKTKSSKTQELSSTSTLAFTSQLSSLIAQGSNTTSHGRPRPSKAAKSDIFSKQNKGAQKRGAADLQEDEHHVKQVHQQSQDIGSIDDATLHRSKRRMEAKVRMYEDMKRGMYLADDSSDEDNTRRDRSQPEDYLARLRRKEKEGLVDFDRKWANEERKRAEASGESEDEEDDDNASIISYEDELGRSRRGTRAEAARAARAKEEEEQGQSIQERWRPNRPDNLIYGETVQSQAFNPEANIASQMAHLAARRDRSATPPEQAHYDADAEVRNRGTGFYAFSRDETERQKQMEDLKHAREETQRQRERLSARAAEHQATIDDRRRQIQELRSKRLAARFLDSFAGAEGTSSS